MCSGSCDPIKIWEITHSISEMVQGGDIATKEDYYEIMCLLKVLMPVTLGDLEIKFLAVWNLCNSQTL